MVVEIETWCVLNVNQTAKGHLNMFVTPSITVTAMALSCKIR
jgi:hypothetical protein